MIQAFTGPSTLTAAQEKWCRDELAGIFQPDIRRSGCAHGLDTLAALSLPPERVHLFAPINQHYNKAVVEFLRHVGASYDPIPGSYRTRNEFLVAGADELHAFLKSPTFYRSGEWMTVNIAKRLDVPVIQHIIP